MTLSGLAVDSEGARRDNPGTVLTEGQRIAWRRDRLGWNQRELAKRAGVGLATVTRIEKDRNIQQATLRAVLGALDAGEDARPDLLRHSDVAPSEPVKEGADAQKLAVAVNNLRTVEDFLATTLENLRRTIAELTESPSESRRKSG
jgi:transcriptional regulator with XRE-family HTH domain